MKVKLLWYAPTSPSPDVYIASVMRRTRDTQSFEGVAEHLNSKGSYCVNCGKKIEDALAHDSSHIVEPIWVVNLIRGAKKWGHFDVFEHVQYSLSIEEVSRVLTHQLVRHRLASYAQISARLMATKNFVVPPLDYLPESKRIREEIDTILHKQWETYDDLVKKGVRPEDARYIVGDGQTTAIIMTLNARSLSHILQMRLHPDAQWEIRALAKEIFQLVKPTAPILWEDPIVG